MISIQTYVEQSRHTLHRLLRQRPFLRALEGGGYFLSGFCLSAAGFAGKAMPIAMSLVSGCSGWQTLPAALGAMAGYMAFWGKSPETLLWVMCALTAALTLQRRDICSQAPLLIPALSALSVAVGGVIFRSAGADVAAFGIYILRIALALGCSWLWRQVITRRGALTDWIGWGVGVFALAQILVLPWLGLGYIAAAALCVALPFPAVAMGGLALDLARVTPVPMTAVLVLAWLVRLSNRCPGWLSRAAPALVYALVMAATGKTDLLPLPGLLLGGLVGYFLPPAAEHRRRRGETGIVQVRLELAAGVLNQARQLLLEAPTPSIDQEALLQKAVQRACSGCPHRSSCKDSRRMSGLPPQLLRKPLLYAQELPITCRKSGRFLTELRRSQEQLYAIEADRRRQGEYRSALMQQYAFLADFLHGLSDQLPGKTATARQFYQPKVAVYGNRPEADNADRCVRFPGTQGLYYVILCDGMGTGIGAMEESRQAVTMLRRLLQAGFPAEHALASLNSLCALRDRAGAVTVDLAQIRLDTGKTVLYKWGAAPSYLVSRGGAERIGAVSAPPGIFLGAACPSSHALTLRREQILLLISDGFPQEEALRLCTQAVGETAALLAARLMGCVRSGQGDDATVVTVELTGM